MKSMLKSVKCRSNEQAAVLLHDAINQGTEALA